MGSSHKVAKSEKGIQGGHGGQGSKGSKGVKAAKATKEAKAVNITTYIRHLCKKTINLTCHRNLLFKVFIK
jgi:hypothetical protein